MNDLHLYTRCKNAVSFIWMAFQPNARDRILKLLMIKTQKYLYRQFTAHIPLLIPLRRCGPFPSPTHLFLPPSIPTRPSLSFIPQHSLPANPTAPQPFFEGHFFAPLGWCGGGGVCRNCSGEVRSFVCAATFCCHHKSVTALSHPSKRTGPTF